MSQAKSDYAAGTDAALPPVVITQHRPKALLAASAEIEAHYAAVAAANAAPPVDPNALPTAPAAVVEPPLQPNLPGIEPPPPPVTPQSNIETPPGDQNWEHQFRSEQGRARAYLRRAEAAETQLADLTSRLVLLENAARNPAPPPLGPLPDLTPEEVETLGPDLLNMVNRRAAIIARQETARLEMQMQALQAGMTATTQTRAAATKEMFYADMDALMPDWKFINTDQGFLNWCGETDVLSGQPRRDLLIDAFNKNDAQRVIAFFKLFVNNGAAPNARAGVPHAPGANQPPKLPLEALAAPGRGASASAKVEEPKNIWSSQDITRFYDDVRRGKFVGREAEQRAYEADLMMAQAEGRIKQ